METHSSAPSMSALLFSPWARLYFIWCLTFQRDNQTSVATKSGLPNFLVSSSALFFKIGLLMRTPLARTALNHQVSASSTSASFPSLFHFLRLVCFPCSCIHCCVITVSFAIIFEIVDSGKPNCSLNHLRLVPRGLEHIFVSRANFPEGESPFVST